MASRCIEPDHHLHICTSVHTAETLSSSRCWEGSGRTTKAWSLIKTAQPTSSRLFLLHFLLNASCTLVAQGFHLVPQ